MDSRRRPNRYEIHDTVVIIYTNKDSQQILCDTEDWKTLCQTSWYVNSSGYARGKIKGKEVSMHRYLMQASSGVDVDHINGKKLDNRKANLRECTHSDNCKNVTCHKNSSTGVSGVSFYKRLNKYKVQITVEGVYIHLGYYELFEDAVKARREAEKIYFKEYSRMEV